MNNKLLITVLATAFAGATLVANEMPDYTQLAIDAQQFCIEHNTESCKNFAAIFASAQRFVDEHGNVKFELTEEEAQKRDAFLELLAEEIAQNQNEITIKDNSLFVDAQAKDAVLGLSEKLEELAQ